MILTASRQLALRYQNQQPPLLRPPSQHNRQVQLFLSNKLFHLQKHTHESSVSSSPLICLPYYRWENGWIFIGAIIDTHLGTQLITMQLLDVRSVDALLGCAPLRSLGQLQAVVCQVAGRAGGFVGGGLHEFGVCIFELTQDGGVGVVDDVDGG